MTERRPVQLVIVLLERALWAPTQGVLGLPWAGRAVLRRQAVGESGRPHRRA